MHRNIKEYIGDADKDHDEVYLQNPGGGLDMTSMENSMFRYEDEYGEADDDVSAGVTASEYRRAREVHGDSFVSNKKKS